MYVHKDRITDKYIISCTYLLGKYKGKRSGGILRRSSNNQYINMISLLENPCLGCNYLDASCCNIVAVKLHCLTCFVFVGDRHLMSCCCHYLLLCACCWCFDYVFEQDVVVFPFFFFLLSVIVGF